MSYKAQTAHIAFDERDGILVGRLIGIEDVVSFHAESVGELRAAFEEAVDDHLDTCARLGKAPEKPASGKLMLRVAPQVHRAALVAAQASGQSLNQWAAAVLDRAARQQQAS